MRILRLRTYTYPEQVSASAIGEDLDNAFEKNDIVSINLTPMPSRGVSDEVRKAYKNIRYEEQHNGYVIIHRFPMIKEGTNVLQKSVKYLLCTIVEYFKGIKMKDIDAVFVGSTPPTQGLLAAKVAQKLSKRYGRKVPFIYNLQDIFPDSLVGTGLTKKDSLLWKIGRKMEDYTYRHADKIIVISEGFKRNIMAKGVPEEKIEVAYNWVDAEAVVPVPDEKNPFFEEFGISRDTFRVVYAGNLGNAQNISIIIDAARKLNENNDIQFVIFGKGGFEELIKAVKEKEHLDNLLILPLQPYDRVSQVYSLGHVCIVACKPGLGGAAMPSKTWSIMSAGSAVLANFDEGELKDILEGTPSSSPLGLYTKAGDLEAFKSAILHLYNHPDLCRQYGENGRKFVLTHLTKEVGTRGYVEVMKSVCKIRNQ